MNHSIASQVTAVLFRQSEMRERIGLAVVPTIADDEFDRLFVVTLGPDGAQLLSLRY